MDGRRRGMFLALCFIAVRRGVRIERRSRVRSRRGFADRDQLKDDDKTKPKGVVSDGMCHDVMRTYSPTPRAEVLQRVCDDLHPVAEHAVQIELFVLVYYRWQEEDQAPVGSQEVPRENDEVGREHGQLVWFGGGHVWLVIPSEVESEELRLDTGARMRTRAVVATDMDQLHAPFYGQDALHLLGRRLRGYQTD